jgi:hypothetical protein
MKEYQPGSYEHILGSIVASSPSMQQGIDSKRSPIRPSGLPYKVDNKPLLF